MKTNDSNSHKRICLGLHSTTPAEHAPRDNAFPAIRVPSCSFVVFVCISTIIAAWIAPWCASALIMTGRGNQPVQDAGWPEGALAVANLKSRVGWWEGPPFGGGEYQFLYRGDTEAFNEALAMFGSILAPALDLVIHDGPQTNVFLKDSQDTNADTRVDWTFTVWVPASWHRLFNNPKSVFDADHPNFRKPVDPPRLDVYIGGGSVDWAKATLPPGVRAQDERASAAGVNPIGGALVRAQVFDMATGKPVRGARVTVARLAGAGQNPKTDYETVAEGISDTPGRVEIAKIPAGTYRVSVAAEGYAPRVAGYDHYGERTFKRFTVEMARSAAARGLVVDSDGKPLNGVKVRTSSVMALDGRGYNSPGPHETATDESGHFELTDLPVGYSLLHAGAPGYHFTDLFTIHELPATNVTLRLDRAGGIRVTVTDQTGAALSQFEGHELIVEVEPREGSKIGSWGGSATVKSNGGVAFDNVPPGEYRITSRPNPANTQRRYAPEQIVKVPPGVPVSVKVVYE